MSQLLEFPKTDGILCRPLPNIDDSVYIRLSKDTSLEGMEVSKLRDIIDPFLSKFCRVINMEEMKDSLNQGSRSDPKFLTNAAALCIRKDIEKMHDDERLRLCVGVTAVIICCSALLIYIL